MNSIKVSSLIRTVTVGYGIAPYQLLLADYTAGQELHLAPKTVIFSVDYLLLKFIRWISREICD